MSDVADKLDIKELPIPTAQRLDVFVCPGDILLERWVSQAGASNFHCWAPPFDSTRYADFCGIALFVVEPGGRLDPVTSAQLRPFYDRAGEEANCFQYQPIEKNFVRRGVDWFNERKTA